MILEIWRANCDFKVLLDSETVLSYLLKYCLKSERQSSTLTKIVMEVASLD